MQMLHCHYINLPYSLFPPWIMLISQCPTFQQGDKWMGSCLENTIRIRCGKLSLLREMGKSVTCLENTPQKTETSCRGVWKHTALFLRIQSGHFFYHSTRSCWNCKVRNVKLVQKPYKFVLCCVISMWNSLPLTVTETNGVVGCFTILMEDQIY